MLGKLKFAVDWKSLKKMERIGVDWKRSKADKANFRPILPKYRQKLFANWNIRSLFIFGEGPEKGEFQGSKIVYATFAQYYP